MQLTDTFLRPSMLPKLALCGHYRSDGEETTATARGNKLDAILRALIEKGNVSIGDLTTEERLAVQWAERTCLALAGGAELIASEDALKIECLGMTGTADVLCEEHQWSADLKSGQKRNYVEQQAAYALGFMERNFCDEWKVYLLYCDHEEVETLSFTLESATDLVRNAIANAHDPKPPTPNEYCGWCKVRFECPARKEQLGFIAVEAMRDLAFDAQPSTLLREFVLRANTVADFSEKAREILKERVGKGEKVPGVSLVTKRGSRRLSERAIESNILRLGVADVLAAYGSMSESKAREIWGRKLPDIPFPEKELTEVPGSTYVRVSQPKLSNQTENTK